MRINSWGRLSSEDHKTQLLSRVSKRRNFTDQLVDAKAIVYGMGRSYGDVCLNPRGSLIMSRGLDRFCSFDIKSGELTCEAGVLIKNIQTIGAANGWMLPVTPGTQNVTVGGAIANDVHGKNHHLQACFTNHLNWIRLERTDGEEILCSRDSNFEWFEATCGGLGLTGIIKEVSFNLRPIESCWLETETIAYSNLSEFLELSKESQDSWEYGVSWIDFSSSRKTRGIFTRGNHSKGQHPQETAGKRFNFSLVPPVSIVNNITCSFFNRLYYYAATLRKGTGACHYEPFFYPLDTIKIWNFIYGPKGFYQYQFVVPFKDGLEAIQDIFAEIARSKMGSFLSVLKTFGQTPSPGLLSFPMEGITLSIDFPNHGEKTLRLFDVLDNIVYQAGGRLYPAKDARMSAGLFADTYPNLSKFLPFRDPGLSSQFSQRLMGW
jgi:FAD/FMN-containing dehydrogenase